eukprot:gene8526-6077_t
MTRISAAALLSASARPSALAGAPAALSAGSLRINGTKVWDASLLPVFQVVADFPDSEATSWPTLANKNFATRPWNQSRSCADPLVPKDVCEAPMLDINPSQGPDGTLVSRTLPYLVFNQYRTERVPSDVPTIRLEDDCLRAR